MSNRPPSAAKTTRRRRDGAVGGADHFHGRLGGTPVRVDATAQLTQARGACGQLVVSQGDARETNTCSKASLLLSFGQMAVGVKVGVGVGGRVGGFRPSFPLDEVGDPALGQGGGLRHVVSDCLRNTCDRQRKRRETSESEAAFKNPIYAKFFLPFREDLASAANSWMPTLFLESAGDFPDFGIISLSSSFTCEKATTQPAYLVRNKRVICAQLTAQVSESNLRPK